MTRKREGRCKRRKSKTVAKAGDVFLGDRNRISALGSVPGAVGFIAQRLIHKAATQEARDRHGIV